MSSTLRRIVLCADDYGISPAVSTAIRDLVARGRINATSVMVLAPSFDRFEAAALSNLNASVKHVAIGLHVTLTGPFRPLTTDFEPLSGGAFLSVNKTLVLACLHRFTHERLTREIASQLKAFIERFGHPPDFVDGHQHVQLFPQIRTAFLQAVKESAPQAWVRQCGRVMPGRMLGDRKAMILDLLSRSFRRRAERLGLRTNPGFAGTYDFVANADIATLFPRFLDCLPDGGLVMCHPGFVDPELKRLDPLTTLREREHAYFSSPAFASVLADNGVTLAPAGELA